MSVWKRRKARAKALELDIAAARLAREAERETQRTLANGIAFLNWRREQNGFGDDLEITFTPRHRNGHSHA